MVEQCDYAIEGNTIANRPHVQRINYLIQAAALVNNFDNNLARIYVKKALESSKKHLLRLDVSIKRHICKVCNTLLTPTKTCSITFRKDKITTNNIQHFIYWTIITCNICQRPRKYPTIIE